MPKLVGPESTQERVRAITRQLQGLVAEAASGTEARLPSERQLAQRFQCSRNTVREALASLAARGLIGIRGRVGAYPVARQEAATGLEAALTALAVAVPGLARLAAARCAANGITRLEVVTSNLSQALLSRDATAAYRWTVTFCVDLAGMAGNPYLSRMLRDILDAAPTIPASRLGRREAFEAFFSGLVELLQALRRGDGPDAAAIAGRCLEAFAAGMTGARPARKTPAKEGGA